MVMCMLLWHEMYIVRSELRVRPHQAIRAEFTKPITFEWIASCVCHRSFLSIYGLSVSLFVCNCLCLSPTTIMTGVNDCM